MLELNMKCPICLTIAEDAHESSCCGHLFCAFCIKSIKREKCPLCRDPDVQFRPNKFINKIMKEMKVDCKFGCKAIVNLSDLKMHRFYCEAYSNFKCTLQNCIFEGKKDDALKHFSEKHPDELIILIENFHNLKSTFEKSSVYNLLKKNSIKDKLSDIYDFVSETLKK